MPDESVADDEAIYDIWRRLTAGEVEDTFRALFALAHAFAERKGDPPTPAMRGVALQLANGPMHLDYLPVIRSILARGN